MAIAIWSTSTVHTYIHVCMVVGSCCWIYISLTMTKNQERVVPFYSPFVDSHSPSRDCKITTTTFTQVLSKKEEV